MEPKVRLLAASIVTLLTVQLAVLISQPLAGETLAAAAPVQETIEPSTTTPPPPTTATTQPPPPVLSDLFDNPFDPGVRPPAAEVQTLFTAPAVDDPSDLVLFQPAYDLIKQITIARWGEAEWRALELLLMHESRFDPRAVEPNTGACGIFQALPCGKMERIDWRGQIEWGLNIYIPERHGTPSAAWAFWLSKAHPCRGSNPYGFVACNGWY